jgi:hypothetical protein
MVNGDKVLKPSQTVRVVRTVSIAYDVNIAEYLDGADDLDGSPITVDALVWDIEDKTEVSDVLDEYSDVEITDIRVEITKIY